MWQNQYISSRPSVFSEEITSHLHSHSKVNLHLLMISWHIRLKQLLNGLCDEKGLLNNLFYPLGIQLSQWQTTDSVGNVTSFAIVSKTGAPQGYVMSPFLFPLYSNDYISPSPYFRCGMKAISCDVLTDHQQLCAATANTYYNSPSHIPTHGVSQELWSHYQAAISGAVEWSQCRSVKNRTAVP